MKILIPIDGSECTKIVLTWASQFLTHHEHSIYLLHVISFTPELPVTDWQVEEGIRMLNDAKVYLEEKGLTVLKAEYLLGTPAEAICDYANENHVSQILMGSHGRTGVSKLLMGSVSESVFKHARQPVLILNTGQQLSLMMSHPEKINVFQCES